MARKSGCERRVLRYLLDRGEPADTGTIATDLEMERKSVIKAIQRNKELFVSAGRLPKQPGRGGGISYLWAAWEE